MTIASVPTELRSRATAFALLARSLGPDAAVLRDGTLVEDVRTALDDAGEHDLADRFSREVIGELPDAERLSGTWTRFFDLGRVAPYEGSNVVATASGVTPRLADIAGFYRSFGVAVRHDRPDHVVAELEFLALASAREADAIDSGDTELSSTCAAVVRSFLRDHAGTWLDAWASRVAAVPELAPWAPYAAAAARLVGRESARRNVIPARTGAVLTASSDDVDDEPLPICGDEAPDDE